MHRKVEKIISIRNKMYEIISFAQLKGSEDNYDGAKTHKIVN